MSTVPCGSGYGVEGASLVGMLCEEVEICSTIRSLEDRAD